jgi:hypothetical protein
MDRNGVAGIIPRHAIVSPNFLKPPHKIGGLRYRICWFQLFFDWPARVFDFGHMPLCD